MIKIKSGYLFDCALISLLFVGAVLVPLSSLIQPVSAATVLTLKWRRTGLGTNWEGGMVVGDVDNDGYEDIVYAGGSTILVLDGRTGATKYSYTNSRIYRYCQPQMDDINNDGRLEILVPLYYRPGLAVLRVNNANTALEVLWVRDVQSGSDPLGSIMSKPVSADIDGDGYSEIFVPSQDVEPNGGYDGTLTLLDYRGNILAQTFVWRSCSGGVSLADTDNDGEFELYMGDRGMYMGDGSYGKGCRSFWAKNLTQRWNNPSFLCSSQAPVLADVNKDGILDVVVSDQRGGIHVLNSTNGAFIRQGSGLGLPVHYQLTVYDVDGDGNLEALCADGDHSRAVGGRYPDEVYVFDLVNWKVDKIISLGSPESNYNPYDPATYNASLAWNNKWSPLVANIYENGNNADGSPRMEIIVGANRTYPTTARLLIFDNSYNLLQNVTGLAAQVSYPFVQDIDNDGLLELVVHSSGGTMYAYDSSMPKPANRIRSEVSFFSELRAGAAVYVPKPWDLSQAPLVAPVNPGDDALNVPTSLTSLRFRMTDRQGDSMNYWVTSSPNIAQGSGSGKDGVYTVPVTGTLQPYTMYTWTVRVRDAARWTNRTYTFKTAFAAPTGSAPTQGVPTLASLNGTNMAGSTFQCQNQSTVDPDGDAVTNLYKWYVNGASVASVLMPFNTRNETIVKDYSGNANDGVVYGATWTQNGRVGGAYSFDGYNDYISISDGGKGYYNNQTSNPGYPAYRNSLGGDGTWTEITIEHWIRLGANSGTDGSWRTIFKAPSYEIGFRQGYSNTLFGTIWYWRLDNTTRNPTTGDPPYTSSARYTVDSNTALSTNTWYHVVLTYKSFDGLRLYINGQLDAERLSTPTSLVNGTVMRSSGEPVVLGAGVGYFKGMIDEVRIYPRALSAAQILNRYQESKDGLSSRSLLIPSGVGATMGSTIKCEVIPSDSQRDGTSSTSTQIVLGGGSPVEYTLTVNVVGSGSVTKNPDQATYPSGTVVTLTAFPAPGYAFTGWSGDASGSTSPTTVTMTSNKVVTATFSPIPVSIFEDGFESGSFSNWSGTSVTSGETATVVSILPHHGSYGARFTTNGGGGTERAYVYKSVDAQSELYVRGYFNIQSGLPLSAADNRFNLFALQSGSTTIASLSVRRSGSADVWSITSVAGTWYASTGPSMNRWYCVEFYAKIDSTAGILRMWVDGVLVLERTGLNTASAGSINQVRTGLVYVYNVATSVTVYSDCYVMNNNYIGTEGPTVQYQLHIGVNGPGSTNPVVGVYSYAAGTSVQVTATANTGYTLSYWLLNNINVGSANPYTVTMDASYNLTAVFIEAGPAVIFEDGFESGNTIAWDSTTVTSGETVATSSEQAYKGTYSLKSTSNGGGGTESARVNKALPQALSEAYVRGYFKLTQNGIADNSDRIKLIELRAGSAIVAAAGLWQSGGTLRWWIETRSGTSYVETYTVQVGSVDLAQWFSVELYWKLGATDGGAALWVNGNQIYRISNADTDNYGSCSALRFGLAELTNCGTTTLYSDNAVVSTTYIGP